MGGSASSHQLYSIPRPMRTVKQAEQASGHIDRSCILVQDQRFNRWVARHPVINYTVSPGTQYTTAGRAGQWPYRQELYSVHLYRTRDLTDGWLLGIMNTGIPRQTVKYSRQSRAETQ
jgi:hypothetical protein